MQVQTLKAHRYDNRMRKPGELYFIKAQDVRLARALGWVGDVQPAAPKIEAPTYRAAYLPAVQAEEKPKRVYRRRDMVAKFTDQE